MNNTLDLGKISIAIPQDCPDAARFKKIVTHAFNQNFASADFAERCQAAFQQSLIVPQPFAAVAEASYHYRRALLALSPDAQAWGAFEDDVNRAFADFEDDGETKDPAIPGWMPDWIKLA